MGVLFCLRLLLLGGGKKWGKRGKRKRTRELNFTRREERLKGRKDARRIVRGEGKMEREREARLWRWRETVLPSAFQHGSPRPHLSLSLSLSLQVK